MYWVSLSVEATTLFRALLAAFTAPAARFVSLRPAEPRRDVTEAVVSWTGQPAFHCANLISIRRTTAVSTGGWTYVVDTINLVLIEGRGVDEESRNEVDVSSQLIDKLGLPSLGSGTLTECAGFAREGRHERSAIVVELAWVTGVLVEEVAQGCSVVRGTAGVDAKAKVLVNTESRNAYINTHLISKEMNSLKPVPELAAAW